MQYVFIFQEIDQSLNVYYQDEICLAAVNKNQQQFTTMNNLARMKTLQLFAPHSLKDIDSSFFNGLHNLSKLDLSDNWIRTFHKDLLKGLKSLRHLILHNCHLEHFTKNFFIDLCELILLDFSQNYLKEITHDGFEGLIKLQILDLSHNLMSEDKFYDCEQYECVLYLKNHVQREKLYLRKLLRTKYILCGR